MLTKRRLLFINTLYSPYIGGGAEIILQEQVEGLHARGFYVSVLTTGPDKGLNISTVNGVTIYRAGLKNLYWHFTKKKYNKFLRLVWHIKDRYNNSMRRYVREIIEKENPDVIICHNLTGWSISVWDEINKAGIPIIQVLHDLYLLCPRSNMFRAGKACGVQCTNCKLFRTKHVEASDKVDVVIGVSNYILSRFEKYGYFNNVQKYVVHNAREIPEIPSKTDICNQILRFGFIGTLSEIKGIEWLINQFQSLNIESTLLIAGTGENSYVNYLKSIVFTNNIKFIGYIDSNEFYSMIDVVIIPSLWEEPFGLVAIEACAHHLPIITTGMGGLSEIIKDKINGLLCDVGNPASLGEAILSLYNNPDLYNQLSKKSRNSVESMLSKEKMLKEYEKIIKII